MTVEPIKAPQNLFDEIISRLQKVTGPDSSGNYTALCPFHDDHNPSLSIHPERGFLCFGCKEKGTLKKLATKLGIVSKPLSLKKRPSKGKIIATYDYRDEHGTLLYQVCRMEPKDFLQRRPDPNGKDGWTWNLYGINPVPYRLPELLVAPQEAWVFIVEGEKDCDNLVKRGLIATTNSGGAGKWRPEFAKYFKGRKVAILPDNDEPGQHHAIKVAQSLYKVASAVRVITLEGLPEKGDVSDWLEAGHKVDELLRLVEVAENWSPAAGTGDFEQEIITTDWGNAKRLVRLHGQDLRYCHLWGKWLVWDGRRWDKDSTAAVVRCAKDAVRNIYLEAAEELDEKRQKALAEHAIRSAAERKISAMISLAASEPGIPVLPDQLDADPWLLNCLNGTLDLRTGELRPHKREDLITRVLPITYDPTATCPKWEAFLNRIMAGNQNLIRFIQRAVGYSLTGDVSEQVFFMCYGTGANGKTVFLRTLLALLGEYGRPVDPELLMAHTGEVHPTIRADLMGARLAVAIETEEGRRLNETLTKWLTGGDKLKARFMRQDFFEFEPTHKIWVATNHKPVIRGTDHAIWRRIRLIPFNVTIPAEEQDTRLPEKLREELPGILAWAVRGCLEWQKHGLGVPEEVKNATEGYRAEMDIIAQFLEEACIIDPVAKARASDLYRSYTTWCEENGEHPLSQKNFGMRLTERGFRREVSNSVRWWRGIGLLQGDTNSTHSTHSTQISGYSRVSAETSCLTGKVGTKGTISTERIPIPDPEASEEDLPEEVF